MLVTQCLNHSLLVAKCGEWLEGHTKAWAEVFQNRVAELCCVGVSVGASGHEGF